MSLKAFHIFFIGLSVVTAFFFGTWLFLTDATLDSGSRIAFGAVSYVSGIVLMLYGRRFLRKFRHLSFM